MTHLKRIFLSLFFSIVAFSFFIFPSRAETNIINNMKTGLKATRDTAFGSGESMATYDAEKFIATGVGVVLGLIGTIFFLIMIYGGVLWMTDPGKEEQVKTAQKLIKNAVIGVLIVSLAYAITSFLGSIVFGK